MASVSGSIGLTNQFQFKEKYEQLKEAEQKEKLLKPRERVDKIDAQHKDIEELINKLNAIKSTANDISESKLLGQKNLKTEGKSATVSVSKGVSAMDFSIDVKTLATKDTFQTNALKNDEISIMSQKGLSFNEDGKSKNELFEKGSFKISIGKQEFEIHLDKFTTLSQLAEKINNAKDLDGKPLKDLLNAKIIDTGKDGYRLMLGSKKAGVENSMKFSISGESEQEKAASEAILKTLGLSSTLDEAKANELLEKSNKLLDDTLKTTGAKKFDTEAYTKSLGASKLELETKSGEKFNVDKDTDIMHLTDEQLDAVYENQRKEEIAAWAVAKGSVGDISISKDNIKELSKDPSKWEKIEDSFYEEKAAEWIKHLESEAQAVSIELEPEVKDSKLEADSRIAAASEEATSAESTAEPAASTPAASEASSEDKSAEASENAEASSAAESTEASEGAATNDKSESTETTESEKTEKKSFLIGFDHNEKEFKDLSADEKKAIIAKYKEILKSGFDEQVNVAKAQDKLDAAKKLADANHIQRGSDAVFKYEGIEISRPENEIKDLIIGAQIKLVKEGKTDFKVEASADELIKNIDEFVSAFNSFSNNINAAVDFDKEAKKAKGTLMGVNEVQDARSKLMGILGKTINDMNLNVLGVAVNKDGIVEFDKSMFRKAYEKDSAAVEKFLLGGTDYKEITHTSKPITAMPVISSGDFIINEKKITLDHEFVNRLNGLNKDGVKDESVTKPTMEEYQQALLKAIKDAEITGIKASFNKEGALVLTSDGKQGIHISGIDDKLTQLGLEVKDIKSTGKANKGVFDEVQDIVKSITGKDGTLKKFNENLSAEKKKITKEMDEVKKDIDKRFDTLKDKLVKYDAILYKMDLQRQAIEGAMKAAFAQKG